MGGYGSGKHWYECAKRTVESCFALDVNWMTREGIFDPDGSPAGAIRWFNDRTGQETSSIGYELNASERWLRLHYQRVSVHEKMDYKVGLATTQLPWAGSRWWFVCALTCNGQFCGRRVGKLYLPPGGRYFGCRHCYDLTYASCQATRRATMYSGPYRDVHAMSGDELMQRLDEALKLKRQMELHEQRKKQRRRRRKVLNWA